MAENNKAGLYLRGKSNGVTSYQDKNNKHWYSVLVVIPNSEQILKVGLANSDNLTKYNPDSPVEMSITPRFYQGKFNGFQEVA